MTNNSKIIVTGANGFIGSRMVLELNSMGLEQIVCVDKISPEQRPQPLSKAKYESFLNKNHLFEFLETPHAIKEIEWIIHMGANSSTTEANWELLYTDNTLYTQHLFNWCTHYGKNLIYASSGATYGSGELGYDDQLDSEKLTPLNLYGESKVLVDRWVAQQTEAPPYWYGLKFFNVFGPNEYHKDTMSSVVYKAFLQIKEKGSLRLFKSYHPDFKDGEQMRDFVYVKDITRWMKELILKKPQSGIYNMGFGKARTWNDLAINTFKSMQLPVDIQYIDMPPEIKDQYQYFTEAKMEKWASNGLSSPEWTLEKAIEDYVTNFLLI